MIANFQSFLLIGVLTSNIGFALYAIKHCGEEDISPWKFVAIILFFLVVGIEFDREVCVFEKESEERKKKFGLA